MRAASSALVLTTQGSACGLCPCARKKPDRPANEVGGPEGKLRGRPPPPLCRAPDLGDGRGLNPSPDEHEPAEVSITESGRATKSAHFQITYTSHNHCALPLSKLNDLPESPVCRRFRRRWIAL